MTLHELCFFLLTRARSQTYVRELVDQGTGQFPPREPTRIGLHIEVALITRVRVRNRGPFLGIFLHGVITNADMRILQEIL